MVRLRLTGLAFKGLPCYSGRKNPIISTRIRSVGVAMQYSVRFNISCVRISPSIPKTSMPSCIACSRRKIYFFWKKWQICMSNNPCPYRFFSNNATSLYILFGTTTKGLLINIRILLNHADILAAIANCIHFYKITGGNYICILKFKLPIVGLLHLIRCLSVSRWITMAK